MPATTPRRSGRPPWEGTVSGRPQPSPGARGSLEYPTKSPETATVPSQHLPSSSCRVHHHHGHSGKRRRHNQGKKGEWRQERGHWPGRCGHSPAVCPKGAVSPGGFIHTQVLSILPGPAPGGGSHPCPDSLVWQRHPQQSLCFKK